MTSEIDSTVHQLPRKSQTSGDPTATTHLTTTLAETTCQKRQQMRQQQQQRKLQQQAQLTTTTKFDGDLSTQSQTTALTSDADNSTVTVATNDAVSADVINGRCQRRRVHVVQSAVDI